VCGAGIFGHADGARAVVGVEVAAQVLIARIHDVEIDVATEVPKLVRALERDKQRDMTPYYVSLPSSTELSAHGSPDEKMVNCLTWARDHIKNVIGTRYKGELDSGLALPVLRIKKVEPPSEQTCMLS
jgi:hypothetical protein